MPRAGVVVEGLEVRFEGGRVVDVSADTQLEAVRAELDTDEGARSLGEVSLVDGSSRVRAAGVVFHNTLYDENAGCHVAWGQCFAMVLPGASDPDQRAAAGLNTSAVHTDVVVGGPGVDVVGTTRDGRSVPLITDDAWVLPCLDRLRRTPRSPRRSARRGAGRPAANDLRGPSPSTGRPDGT